MNERISAWIDILYIKEAESEKKTRLKGHTSMHITLIHAVYLYLNGNTKKKKNLHTYLYQYNPDLFNSESQTINNKRISFKMHRLNQCI